MRTYDMPVSKRERSTAEAHFERLAGALPKLCGRDAVWSFSLQAERSDFVRFNHGAIRQPGTVTQAQARLRLVDGQRHAEQTVALSGRFDEDLDRLTQARNALGALLPEVPEDPYLVLNSTPDTSHRVEVQDGLDALAIVDEIVEQADGLDLVGILSCGPVMNGMANSHGVRHWHEIDFFDFDFSLHLSGDKAVKASYAGRQWDPASFADKLDRARRDLALLARPARSIAPGEYRAYLAPAAVADLLSLMQWGGFSAKEQRTRRSSLQRLVNGESQFSSRFTLADDPATGIAPTFGQAGFRRAAPLKLIEHGQHANPIVAPRTGAEYGIAHTGADDEIAVALALDAGGLAADEATLALGTGLYVNNLWYLNYSDRVRGRVTGMTRFATFWVEDGVAVAPCDVMRFDDSLFGLFGDALEDLTRERELVLDGSSYGGRSTNSTLAPGVLLSRLALTL